MTEKKMEPPEELKQLPEDVRLMIENEEISLANRERFQQLLSCYTDKKAAPIELHIDATEAINQINEVLGLIELPSGALEGIPEHLFNLIPDYITSLLNNVVLGDFSTAISATDTNEICLKVKIVGPLQHLASAIRTGNLHGLLFEHCKTLSSAGENKD